MTAEEARKNADNKNILNEGSQYQKIIEQIKKASDGGEYYVWVYVPINMAVRTKLTNDGFDVGITYYERGGECITKISW